MIIGVGNHHFTLMYVMGVGVPRTSEPSTAARISRVLFTTPGRALADRNRRTLKVNLLQRKLVAIVVRLLLENVHGIIDI